MPPSADEASAKPSMPPRARTGFGKRVWRSLVLAGLLVLLAIVLMAQTGRGQEMVLRAALGRLQEALAGDLTTGGIRSGTLLTGATLTDVRLDAEAGRPFLTADSVVVRYSLLSFLLGGGPIRSTTIWGLDLEIARRSGDDAMNVTRLLAEVPADTPGKGASEPLALGHVGVREGKVRILTPAVAGTTAPTVTEANGERLRQLAFTELDLDLENAVLVPGASVAFDAHLASFSSNIFIRDEPLVVDEVFADVTFGAQGILISNAAFRLSESLMRGDIRVGPRRAGDPWTLRADLDSDGWADLRDVGWIDPRVPEGRFRGAATIVVDDGINVDLDDLEIELEASHAVVDGPVHFGETMSMESVVVTGNPITLERLEPWLGYDFPIEGWLSGRATFSGTLENLSATGRVTLVPTGYGGNPTTADFSGTVHRGPNPGASAFEARLLPFNYTVLESLWPGLPWEGTGSAQIELDGRVDDGLRIVADFSHEPNSAQSSRVVARGVLWRGVEAGEWITNLSTDLLPLSIGAFDVLAPDLGLQGVVSGTMGVEGPLDRLDVRAELTVDGGTLGIDAEVNLLSPAAGYRLSIEADSAGLASVSSRLPAPTSWSGRASIDGAGLTPDSLEAVAEVVARASRVGAVQIDTVAAGFSVSRGVLTTDSLAANIAGVDVVGRGRLGLTSGNWGASRFEFSGPSLVGLRPLLMGVADSVLVRDDLSELDRDFMRLQGVEPDTLPTERDVRMQGVVSGAASMSGELRDFDLGVIVQVVDGRYKQNEVDSVQIAFTATDLPALSGAWEFGATGLGIVWGDRTFEQGGFEAEMFGGRGEGRVEVVRRAGERYRALGDFRLDSLGGDVGLREAEIRAQQQLWTLSRPARIAWDATSLRVDSLELRRTDADPMHLLANGTLTRGGESDFTVDLEGLHVEEVMRVLQREDLALGGHFNLDLTVRGPSESPRIEGAFLVDGPRYEAIQLSRIEGSLDYVDQRVSFELDGRDGVQSVLQAEGSFPFNLGFAAAEDRVVEAPLDIQISADSLDAAIALSYLTTLEQVLGTISGDVSIRGTPSSPEPDGEITLVGGEWSIETIGVRHTGVNGVLRLHPNRVVDVALTSRGVGSSDVTGTILLEPFRNPALNLGFSFNGFQAVSRPDIEAMISGRFVLSGTYRRPVAQGAITVDQANVYVDEFRRVADAVDLRDPFLFEGGIAVDTTVLIAQPFLAGFRNPFFDNLRVDVELTVPRDTWLRSNETNVELVGDLLVRYDRSAGDFVLIGELQALRGSHLVLGRTFEVESGTVGFIGRPGLNPDLDIQAVSRIRRIEEGTLEVTAHLEGNLVAPIVTLTSDETGVSESDLVSYLVFGQPNGALGRNQSDAVNQIGRSAVMGGLTFFGGMLANQFVGSIAQGTGLIDYLSVQQSGANAIGTGYFSETHVELGSYLDDDVFMVMVLRPFRGGARETNYVAGVRVEWALTDDYNVEAFVEDRFLRSGSAMLGRSQLLDDGRVLGVFFFREWGY